MMQPPPGYGLSQEKGRMDADYEGKGSGLSGKDSNNAVFAALDEQRVSWFHIKTVIIAGMGFFTDAYDLFCIGLLTKTIGRIYYAPRPDFNLLYTPYYPVNNIACLSDINSVAPGATGYIPTPNPAFNPTNAFCGTYSGSSSSTFYDPGALTCQFSTTKYAYPPCPGPGALPIAVNAAVSGVALCGTLAGQLIWGWLGDVFGRKAVYGYTLIIMIIAAIGQSTSFGFTQKGVIGTLCFWRFILGFGIGGDYPLSATIMSEYASKRTRGAFVGAVFAMQGIGYIVAATFTLIVTAIARASCSPQREGFDPHDPAFSVPPVADMVWRTVLCFGAIPAALTLYWRSTMPETARFTALVQADAAATAANMGSVLHKDFSAPNAVAIIPKQNQLSFNAYMRRKEKGMRFNNGILLFGCAACWFLLDVAYYSQGLFQKDVFTTVGWLPAAGTMDTLTETWLVARAQAITALASTIPGYWVTVFTVDYIGRWPIQFGGFFMMTLWMAILAGDYNDLVANNTGGFVTMYMLTFFFSNWGPNATTFIVPSELFSARFRSTCHGIAAASGKAGAIVGAFGFLYASEPGVGECDPTKGFPFPNPCAIRGTDGGGYDSNGRPLPPYPHGIGLQKALGILAATNFAGMLFTFLIPETMNRSLEDLSGEAGDEVTAEGLKSYPTDFNGHMKPENPFAASVMPVGPGLYGPGPSAGGLQYEPQYSAAAAPQIATQY